MPGLTIDSSLCYEKGNFKQQYKGIEAHGLRLQAQGIFQVTHKSHKVFKFFLLGPDNLAISLLLP